MSTVEQDLASFQRFVRERIASGGTETSLDELMLLWNDQQSADEVNAAIRQGFADVKADRFQPAEKVMDAIGNQFNFDQ